MDNDNKIVKEDSSSLHEEVMLFLGDEVKRIHQEAEDNSYDIEKEYAKTKKNKSPFNVLVLLICFAVVIGTVFFMNKYISSKDEEISVSLSEFEDLNLNNLLNSVQTAQVNYDNALKEKLRLETDYETKLNSLNGEKENSLFVLDSLNLSNKKEYNRRKNVIETEYKNSVTEVNKEYEGKLLLAQKEVDVYKEQLDEFDTVKVSNAQEKEKLLNSERQLKQLEINKLTKEYEERLAQKDSEMKKERSAHTKEMREAVQNVALKYQAEIDTLDPKLTDLKAMTIMNGAGTIGDFNADNYIATLAIQNNEVIKDLKNYQKLYDDFKYLDDVVKTIPQKNSIPSYTKATRSLVNIMGRSYAESSNEYIKHIDEKNNIILEKENEITDLNKKLYEQKVQNEKNVEMVQSSLENTYSNVFSAMGVQAVLLNAAGYENMQVFVSPSLRSNIGVEGVKASIVIPKVTEIERNNKIKVIRDEIIYNGIVVQGENNTYYFESEKDENGNIVKEIDFSLLQSGMNVNLAL